MEVNISQPTLQKSSIKEIFKNTSVNLQSRLLNTGIPQLFKKKKYFVPSIIILLIVIFLVFRSFTSAEVKIPTFKARSGNFLVSITESGELRARNSVSLFAPRIRGNIKIIFLIPEGTFVKAGDVVVKFDPTEALNSLKEAESRLELAISDKEKQSAEHRSQNAQMDSDLRSAELTYELSKLSLEQMRFEAEVKQQQAKLDHQKNELNFQRTKKDIESKKIVQQSEKNRTEIELKQRRSEVERAQKDLEMLTLNSPAEGLVVYESNWSNSGRKFSIGDNVWGGMTIITLPDLSQMESKTFVNEVDVSKIKKGQEVMVKLDAFQDSTFKGTITDVASLGKTKEQSSNIKIFELTVGITSRSPILKPGMTTNNKFIINQIPNVISVPQEAVFEKNGKKIVYVKKGGSFDEQLVEIGVKSENFVVITKGLTDGIEVALRDPTLKIDEVSKQKEEQTKTVQMPKAGK